MRSCKFIIYDYQILDVVMVVWGMFRKVRNVKDRETSRLFPSLVLKGLLVIRGDTDGEGNI